MHIEFSLFFVNAIWNFVNNILITNYIMKITKKIMGCMHNNLFYTYLKLNTHKALF